MKYFILVSSNQNGLAIANHLGLNKETTRFIMDYTDTDDYEEYTKPYENLVVIARYVRTYCSGGLKQNEYDRIYHEAFDGRVYVRNGDNLSLRSSSLIDGRVPVPFSTLSVPDFLSEEGRAFAFNFDGAPLFNKFEQTQILFERRLKTLIPIHYLVGDISQDLLECSYNEDEVRELWVNDGLNDYLEKGLDGTYNNCTKKFIEKYKIKNNDLQSHLTQAVRLANGWPENWTEEYKDLAPLTEKELDIIKDWEVTHLKL